MYLAIQAKLPLDDMEALVEKHFAKLPGSRQILEDSPSAGIRGRPRPYQQMTMEEIFQPTIFDQVIHVEAIDNRIELILTWPVPSQASEFLCKPSHFLEQLLDNEGQGGLLRRLKDLHLIQRGESQIHEGGNDDNSMFSLFCMTLRLSKHGYKNIAVILENVHAYLRLLQREQGHWPDYYAQLKQIYDSQFRFQGEQRMLDDVQRLSTYLKYFPEEHVLDGCHLYFAYDHQLIAGLLDRLVQTRPAIMICSQQKRDAVGDGADEGRPIEHHVEHYTQAKYTMRPVPEKWRNAFQVSAEDDVFSFPPPNQFVTTDFSLANDKVTTTTTVAEVNWEWPQKIAESDLFELWFKPDTKFGLPKLFVNLQLILPMVCRNSRHLVLLDVFGSMLSRELIKELHGANVAGYGCSMIPKPLGVTIAMTGFSQRLPAILAEVLSRLNEGFPRFARAEQFELTKEEMLCSYVNTLLYVDGLSAEVLNGVVEDGHVAAYDKYRILHGIAFEDVLRFGETLFKEMRMKCLVQGNATADGAMGFVQLIVDQLKPAAVDEGRRQDLVICGVELPLGEVNSVQVAAFNKTDVNSSLCQYYEVGVETVALDCALQLMLMLMEEPLFDTLRTKKQLGYDVGAQIRYNHGLVGFCVTVVSQENKFPLDVVEAEVNEFVLEEFAAFLEDLDEEDFEESRNALIELKAMPDQDLEEEVQRNWGEICNETYRFDRLAREREWLAGCKREDILELYEAIVDEGRRKLLCVQVKGNASGTTSPGDCEKEIPDTNEGDDDDEKKHDFSLKLNEDLQPAEGGVVKDIVGFKSQCKRYRRVKMGATTNGDCNGEPK